MASADLRSIGSGNIGATNVLRTGRKDLAAATLLLDALKGLAAVLIVGAFAPGLPPLFAAAGAFLGHVFPVWLGFRGGKGVATFLGCLFGLDWHVGLSFHRHMDWCRRCDSLFLCGCACCQRRCPLCFVVRWTPRFRNPFRLPDVAALVYASRQYRAPCRRDWIQDRGVETGWR